MTTLCLDDLWDKDQYEEGSELKVKPLNAGKDFQGTMVIQDKEKIRNNELKIKDLLKV